MAPFDKITIDFCRSRRRLHDSDLPGAKKHKIDQKSRKYKKHPEKLLKNNGFLGFIGGDLYLKATK